MFPLVKLLKIALPVATVTSATIATTFLVSLSKKDQKKKEKDIDEQLNDFKKPSEDFKDKKMYYSKDSNQKNLVALDQDLSPDLLAELEKKIKDLPSGPNLLQTGEDIEKLLSSPSPKSDDHNDNSETLNSIDVPKKDQDNNDDTSQLTSPPDLQISNQSLKQNLSDQEEGANDIAKQLGEEELGTKSTEDSKEQGTSDISHSQEAKKDNLDGDSKVDEPTEPVLQSQLITSDADDEGKGNIDSLKNSEPEKISSENGSGEQDVSREEGELGGSSSELKGDAQEEPGQGTEENLGDQVSVSGKSQNDGGEVNNQTDRSAYGSKDSEDSLGVDSSGGEITEEKLRELLDIKGQAEDLLGSLGQMLNIIS